jgi:hypothetical protein
MADEDKGGNRGGKGGKRTQKPIYAVMQILDDSGMPVALPKEQVNIVGGFRNADGVLDIIEGGKYPHAIYKRVPLA